MASPTQFIAGLDVRVRRAYWLRIYRERLGLTQDDAAEAFGPPMRRNEISAYETATRRPSDEKLVRIAEIYGVDVQAFYAPLPEDGAA